MKASAFRKASAFAAPNAGPASSTDLPTSRPSTSLAVAATYSGSPHPTIRSRQPALAASERAHAWMSSCTPFFAVDPAEEQKRWARASRPSFDKIRQVHTVWDDRDRVGQPEGSDRPSLGQVECAEACRRTEMRVLVPEPDELLFPGRPPHRPGIEHPVRRNHVRAAGSPRP